MQNIISKKNVKKTKLHFKIISENQIFIHPTAIDVYV